MVIDPCGSSIDWPKVIPEGDSSVRIEVAGVVTQETIEQTWRFRKAIEALNLPGVRACVSAYCVVSVLYDPLVTSFEAIASRIEAMPFDVPADTVVGRTVHIPVCYAEEFATDILEVAETVGISVEDLVARHCEPAYCVAAMGFVPGFAYLHGLPDALKMPRLATSRVRVPRGSVAIGGAQTGVYPLETPGGWRIIGRTPLTMFDPKRTPASLLQLGDTVRFYPITLAEFQDISQDSDPEHTV